MRCEDAFGMAPGDERVMCIRLMSEDFKHWRDPERLNPVLDIRA